MSCWVSTTGCWHGTIGAAPPVWYRPAYRTRARPVNAEPGPGWTTFGQGWVVGHGARLSPNQAVSGWKRDRFRLHRLTRLPGWTAPTASDSARALPTKATWLR